MADDGWLRAAQNALKNYTQAGDELEYALALAIYCVNPPEDDGCPIGICPNPDIAGPLLRIAHYVTALCLTILILYAPERVEDAFYYQMSTVYALLITCSVSLFQQDITRFHATIAITIASSPVSFYFLFYSIRAFWGEHRLDAVLGKKKYLNRGLVFFAAGIWISMIVYTSLKSTRNYFTQKSCDFITVQEFFVRVVLNPRVLGLEGLLASPWCNLGIAASFSWLVSIVLARKEIWPPGERYRPKFVTIWKTIGRRYPFVFFITVGAIPMALWIWTTEWSVWAWADFLILDTQLSPSFGQTLALFIAVPPFLQVCHLIPRLWSWFINLTWIACLKRKREAKQPAPTENPDLSHGTYYIQLEDSMLSKVRNSQLDEGKQETQEPGVCLEPNRYYGP